MGIRIAQETQSELIGNAADAFLVMGRGVEGVNFNPIGWITVNGSSDVALKAEGVCQDHEAALLADETPQGFVIPGLLFECLVLNAVYQDVFFPKGNFDPPKDVEWSETQVKLHQMGGRHQAVVIGERQGIQACRYCSPHQVNFTGDGTGGTLVAMDVNVDFQNGFRRVNCSYYNLSQEAT